MKNEGNTKWSIISFSQCSLRLVNCHKAIWQYTAVSLGGTNRIIYSGTI